MSDINEENFENTEQKSDGSPPICEAETRLDGALYRAFGKFSSIVSLAAVILGAVGLVAYIVFSVWAEESGEQLGKGYLLVLLFGGAACFTVGLIFLLTARRNAAKADRTPRVNRYLFFEDSVLVTEIRAGEDLGTVKVYYRDLVKVREKKSYFLLYPNTVTFFPVEKGKLTEEEIAKLRGVLSPKGRE